MAIHGAMGLAFAATDFLAPQSGLGDISGVQHFATFDGVRLLLCGSCPPSVES